jgi:hypothetical protein
MNQVWECEPYPRTRLEAVLHATVNVDSILVIREYPDASSIRSLEDTDDKYVAFIDFGNHSDRALALAGEIHRCPSPFRIRKSEQRSST